MDDSDLNHSIQIAEAASRTSLSRTDRPHAVASSARSATVAPRRVLESSLNGLLEYLQPVSKQTSQYILPPRELASEIHRFRRHYETSIFQRHKARANIESDADKSELESLCMSLVLFIRP